MWNPRRLTVPGYPIEKRGLYYLARSLSSQLSLATETTDYGQLEKCYSIWICRDDISEEDRYSISFYEVLNSKNIGGNTVKEENYDLMTLVIIKLGNKEYNGKKGEEGFELLHFLNLLMYPHSEDFIENMSDYIDFSDNEELWKEAPRMFSLSQCIYEDGFDDGKETGIERLVKAIKQISGTENAAVQQLMEQYGLSEKDALTKMNLYWNKNG